MTTYADWRVGPDPRPCISCTATLAGCQNKRGFSGRCCCDNCDHHPEEAS